MFSILVLFTILCLEKKWALGRGRVIYKRHKFDTADAEENANAPHKAQHLSPSAAFPPKDVRGVKVAVEKKNAKAVHRKKEGVKVKSFPLHISVLAFTPAASGFFPVFFFSSGFGMQSRCHWGGVAT